MKNLECGNCKGCHHTLVCEPKRETQKTETTVVHLAQDTEVTNDAANIVFLLQTAMIRMEAESTHLLGRCLIDGGSMRTFILKKTSTALKLPIVGYEEITVHAFGGVSKTELCKRVSVKISSHYDNQSLIIEAIKVEKICASILSIPSESIKNLFKLKGWNMADPPRKLARPEDGDINILIGVDYYAAVMKSEVQRIQDKLIANNTIFGWVVSGPQQTIPKKTHHTPVSAMAMMSVVTPTTESNEVTDPLEMFWKLEHLGIKESINGKVCQEQVLESPVWKNHRYEVGLPWLEGTKQHLASNYLVARKRLGQLLRQLMKTPDVLQQYDQVIREYLEQGIIEHVKVKMQENEPVYYLPHKAVIKEDRKTTKLRIVFDACSHASNELCLNQCLWSGSDLLNDLFDLLLRFRRDRVAVTGDIEKAFLQIGLKEEDRDAVRFLWTVNLKDQEDPAVYRFTRVLFGVTSSPALLSSTLKFITDSYAKTFPVTAKTLEESLYVDDLVASVQSTGEAGKLRKEAKEVLASGGFTMRKWCSSDSQLRNTWKEEEETDSDADIKVLGLVWYLPDDTLSVAAVSKICTDVPTKRSILRDASKVFDPLGFVAPFVIRVKILLQDIWREKLGWDEPTPESIMTTWRRWANELEDLNSSRLPRWMAKNYEEIPPSAGLHIFVDASEKAYAAVAFLRLEGPTQVTVSFLA